MKNIAIIGASGFVGSNLIEKLLEETDWQITAISPNPEDVNIKHDRLTNIEGDVFATEKLAGQLEGVDVVYYFVHMMAAGPDYDELEEQAAHSCGQAASEARVERIVYMSGLGDDEEDLSKHLESRHNTGRVMREYEPTVIEFRASMIIGAGSISFQIIQNLVHKLPLLLLPPTTKTKTQPIALPDMLAYLQQAATVEVDGSTIVEVGGPEVFTYQELIEHYAEWADRFTATIRLPYLPGFIAGLWLNLFNPSRSATVARAMVDSFKNEMVKTDDTAEKLFPDIKPGPIKQSFS
jgi:uncharacterized protein YbjT (DUF2867 family)